MVVQAHPKRSLGRKLPRQAVIPVISLSGLVKDFGATRALDHLDLTVRSGEVHGFLGPNGAGKTTTVRILLGLIRGTAGKRGPGHRSLAGRRDAPPPPRLRARRGEPVAQPHRR